MLNMEEIKKIITEIVSNKNLTYFIDNYTFEIRKNIIDIFKEYSDQIEELVKNEYNFMLLLSNLYTNSEAKELFDNCTNEDDKMFYGLNLSDEEKEKIINTHPYDDSNMDMIIESLKDEIKKEEYKKRLDINNYIEGKSDEFLKEYISNFSYKYNIVKILKNLKNDKDKYDYMIKYELDIYDARDIISTIENKKIIVDILIDDRIDKGFYINNYFELLSDEDKYTVIENYINTDKDISLYIKEISSLSSEYKNKLFKLEKFDFNEIDPVLYKSIAKDLIVDDELADILVKLFKENKIPKGLIILFDSNYLLKELISKTIELFDIDEIKNMLNSINDNIYIKEIFNQLKDNGFNLEDIIVYFNNSEVKLEYLYDVKNEEFKSGKKTALLNIFFDDKESLVKAINDPRINFDLLSFQISEIAQYLNDEQKIELIKNNKIITDKDKFDITNSLSYTNKLEIIKNNLYGFNADDLIKLLISVDKTEENDLIKLKEFKRLLDLSKIDNSFNEHTIKSMLGSFSNKNIVVDLLNSNIVENAYEKGEIILYTFSNMPDIDDLKIRTIKEVYETTSIHIQSNTDLLINLISSLSNDDLKIKLVDEVIKDEMYYVSIKTRVLEKIKDPKYDKLKIDFIKENIKKQLFTYLIDSVNDINLINEIFIDNNIDIYRRADILSKLKDVRYENIKINLIEELLIIDKKSHYNTFLIKSLVNEENKLKYLIKSDIFYELDNYIIHNDYILSVKEINEDLIDAYATRYNINKEHLIVLIKKYSYEILRSLTNDKIIELINSNEDTFNKIIRLFDIQETILVNDSHIDSVLHALLQKDYKLNNREIFNTFNNLVELITKEEYSKVIEKLEEIINYFKLNNIDYELEIFNKFNTTYVDFINNISDKSNLTNTLNILNAITNKYILENRNEYSNNHFNEFKNSLNLERTYEKNGLLKQFINSLNLDTIISYIKPHAITDEEKELVNNKELLENIINLKKGNEISIDKSIIFSNIKIFNGLLDKLYMSGRLNHMGNDTIKSTYNIKKDNSSIIRILQELDIELLNKELLNNNELYDSLLNYLKSYRMIGWGNTFNDLSERVDMDLDENTIASFLNNYYLIYPKLQKKLEKDNKTLDEKRKITLTSFLEEAEVYASDSYKYKKILGTETFRLIRTNPGPNDARKLKKDERLEQSLEKVKDMYNREYITIPPSDTNIEVSDNKTLNYSVGYTTDIMNLTYGERTGACMRIGGHADDLFDFCLKNENGFHIKITDPNTNELVSRASGFRNGNTVFLNQLRYSLSESYTDEEIIEGLKIFSNNIIEETKDSEYPIKNVVISNMYAMDIKRAETIDMNCHNYKEGFDKFYMDLTSTNAILLAGENEDLYPIKLGPNNTVKYKVLREKIKEEQELETIIDAVDRLHMINDLLRENNIDNSIAYSEQVNLDNVDKMYYGEDWYILLDENNEIIDEFRIERNIGYIEQLEEMNSIKEKLNKERGVRL